MLDSIRHLWNALLGSPKRTDRSRPSASLPPIVDRTGQHVHCDAFPVEPLERHATLAGVIAQDKLAGYVPAAFVAQKAKTVVDGVLAALEGLSTEGDELGMGVKAFLSGLSGALKADAPAQSTIETAIDLASGRGSPRAQAFVWDTALAKPLGFYTWTRDLERVFRRDRYLQKELEPEEAETLAAAIGAEPRLRVEYERHMRRVARLTNPFARASLLERIAGRPPRPPYPEALFPPSNAIENVYGSVAAFFRAVREGKAVLTPAAAAGFYAHQQRAIDALLRPDATEEAARRSVGPEYLAALDRFAAGTLFFARESHVKQVMLTLGGRASPRAERRILPGLTVEPLPSYYAWTADALRFLRGVVEEGWGRGALDLPQLREGGPVNVTVSAGIDEGIAICDAAADLSRRELSGQVAGPEVDSLRALLWGLASDPDVTVDARGMVPLGFTPEDELRVLLFAGWEVHGLSVKLTQVDAVPENTGLGREGHPLPIPLVRELVIPRNAVLDRGEVRALCDRALGMSQRGLLQRVS